MDLISASKVGKSYSNHTNEKRVLNKGCVNYTVALPFTFKKYLKAKEES
jgi:hypothetical protein